MTSCGNGASVIISASIPGATLVPPEPFEEL
jgi:hypothetical protein